jgi:hypothetical protein
MRTMMLAVAAVATNLAAVSLLLTVPFLQNIRAVTIVMSLSVIGILLPAFWLGAVRRLSYDALLAHIVIVDALVLLFLSAISTKALTAVVLLALAYFAVGVFIPLVTWFIVRIMEDGEARGNASWLVLAYIKGIAQSSFGFGVWLICFLFVYRIIG